MAFLDSPLDLDASVAVDFQRGVQGNILKGHGRDHASLVFIAFNSNAGAARAWIKGSLRKRLRSAAEQASDTRQWRTGSTHGVPFATFFLSRDGYIRIGLDDTSIPGDIYFRAGMKSVPVGASNTVSDPPPARWEAAFRGRIDAMVLLADDDPKRLDASVAAVLEELGPLAERAWIERGDKLRFDFPGRPGIEIEHFGHQDGISQPQMIKQEADKEIGERGGTNWDPTAPLSLAFVEETPGAQTYGSYLVFRKLEQRVKSFHDACEALGAALGIEADDAAALAVGRHRDGRPVVPTAVEAPGADPNDFNFKTDVAAGLCPFQAHIRKTNPRGDLARLQGATDAIERSFRISRRGITYGSRPDLQAGSSAPTPDGGVGLLFMSYQANLRQFVIQQEGSDSNDFVQTGVGVDAVLGNNSAPVAQRWPRNGAASDKSFAMSGFVRFLGGEYFFAPSLAFIERLAIPIA